MKKKGAIIVAILLILGVVLAIVFVSLFKDKDTKDLTLKINSVVEEGYLNEDDEDYKVIKNYFDTMTTKLNLPETQQERYFAAYGAGLYKSVSILGKFVNENFVNSKYTNVYKSNKKKIEKNLSKAQNFAKTLSKEITDSKAATNGSDFWTINTWLNFETEIDSFLEYNNEAFRLIIDVYNSCVNSVYYNNDLSFIILEKIKDRLMSSLTLKKTIVSQEYFEKLINFENFYLVENFEKITTYIYEKADSELVKRVKYVMGETYEVPGITPLERLEMLSFYEGV